ncbi:MAG: leucine-rich repeat domain-containing protein [Bacteroidales bacterium]|nr:leucine-rich repeat domain-containing protein [Bacteroidales bacterium]MBR6929658.1 leucine-rich repeat domain-containing protein [Bacteroidales bacterium]
MKKLITITVLLALAMSGMAQQFSFSAVCESGQTLYYRITDAEAHTVILTHPYPQEGNPSFQGNYYEGYVKPAGEIIIPTVVTYNGTDYTVTAIDSNTFFECTGLTGTLDIPDGIVSIGEYAFLECGFSSISIHSSVCSIVLGAFANCRSIESITVDEENPTYYSENNAVIRREDKALVVGCKTTTIPDDIEIIGSYAFGGTGDGGDLVVPNSIRTIEEYAFMGCGFSGSIILSEALETIGKYAFSGGYFSGSLTIPNSVTEMGHNAFSYCQYLTGTLTLSSSLSTIDGSAFYNTHFTGTLSIPNSVKSIGGRAFCLNNFSELVLGDSLVTIVDAAFENCNNLTGTLRLPSSVTQIGSWAFCHTSFNEIYSPNKIPPTLGFNVFYEYDPNIPIHIPFGCTEAYQNAEGWNYFTNFIEEIPIIYREFDPPLEIVQNIYGPGQTLELDFDGDGVSDHRFYGESTDNLKWHEWDLLEVSLNGWETRLVGLDEIDPYTFDENDTIIPNAPNGWRHGSNHAYYYYPSLSANGIFHEHYGIHKVIEGRNYYGWYHGYGIEGSEYSGGPYLFKVYIDKIAFCTIPDYPLRWGQTSLDDPTNPFAVGDLLYEIISTDPPRVSVVGHVDGENAQGELVIPETVVFNDVTYTVTEIGDQAFANCTGLTGTLVFPDSGTVEIIGEVAFARCSGLTGLVLPNGLREIREKAFVGCTGFTGTLNFPTTLTHIKYGAFADCTGFSGDLVFPDSLVEVGHSSKYHNMINTWDYVSTFANCFDHLVLPQSLDTIGMYCFFGCTQLVGNLVLPSNLKYIGVSAFEACSGFTGTVTIPENVSIGPRAFEMCEGIEGLVLPHNITFTSYDDIKGYVFQGCTSLTELDIPEGWTRIEQSLFAYCSNLTTILLPESLSSIEGDAFSNCTSLEEINLPDGVMAIGANAFRNCISLTHIELPFALETLGAAFGGCTSLSGEVVIPDLVQRINLMTFDSCYMLNRVVFGNSVNYIAEPAFEHTELSTLILKTATPPNLMRKTTEGAWHFPADIHIIVPCGALEAYQNDENWGTFTNITEDCGNGMQLTIGAEWYYEIQNLDGSITYQHLECVGDTLFDREGKRPKIIIRSNTQYDKDLNTEMTHEYVYEENGKVYWWNKDLEEFTVLYDLAANVGDEWEIKVGTESLTMHVDAVEYTEYEGHTYRTLRVSDENDLFSGDIVCGIGHLTSFFPERLMTRDKCYHVDGMRCYWVDGELAFKLGDDDCDKIYLNLHSGIEEDDPSTGSGAFMVYPNPANDVLFVETHGCASIPAGTEYRITNLMGQTVLSGLINAEKQQIDISRLPAGMYFINVGDGTRKFVVK